MVRRSSSGRKNLRDYIRERSGFFMLLDVGALPRALFADLAARVASLLRAISLPDEHVQGAAVRDHLSGDWNLSTVQKKVLAAGSAQLHLYAHLRHVCTADPGGAD